MSLEERLLRVQGYLNSFSSLLVVGLESLDQFVLLLNDGSEIGLVVLGSLADDSCYGNCGVWVDKVRREHSEWSVRFK